MPFATERDASKIPEVTPVRDGGLGLSRPIATAVIGVFIFVCILALPQRAGRHPTDSG